VGKVKKILIIQPYIPAYRREFFSQLHQSCLLNGLDLTIFAPKPDKEFSLRKDSISGLPFIKEVAVIRFRILNRQIDFYRYPTDFNLMEFDVVIMEQTLKNVQYPFRVLLKSNKTKIALWGHGRTIVKEKSKFEQWLQLVLSKRADFIFTYTSSGREYLMQNQYPSRRVVALQNTNSTKMRLDKIKIQESSAADSIEGKDFRCCFIGALESSKGLSILFEALPIIKAALPKFQFTFIGDGPDSVHVSEFASSSDYIKWLGFKNQEEIDQISHQFSLILNPGRVGLIAVDSLMLLLPIVTLGESFHAPEYEYIAENDASMTVFGSAQDYARCVVDLLSRPEEIQKMRAICSVERENYTLESMVLKFTDGLLRVLS
jgi:glycosyltransferase involved in cell wall biosynthesis